MLHNTKDSTDRLLILPDKLKEKVLDVKSRHPPSKVIKELLVPWKKVKEKFSGTAYLTMSDTTLLPVPHVVRIRRRTDMDDFR